MIYRKNFTKTDALFTILQAMLLLVFVFFALYFAVRLERNIIPDEHAHFYMSRHFSTTLGIPPDNERTVRLALTTMQRKPFLYYWMNGRLIGLFRMIQPSASDWRLLLMLRLTSVLYSTATVIFCGKLAKEVIAKRWYQLLAVFMMVSTLMFVFLSGGVNYDNLANLCCIGGAYWLVRVWKGADFWRNSMRWMAFMFTGSMVKITILPLTAIMGVLWLVYLIRKRSGISFTIVWNWKFILLIFFVIFMAGLNVWIYGSNLIQFRSFNPRCSAFLSQEQCDRNIFTERAEALNYPEKKLTLLDVIQMNKQDPVEYFMDYWFASMLSRIYGIMGHESYSPDLIITFYRLFYGLALLVSIRYANKPSYWVSGLAVILLTYTAVIFSTNYNSELNSNFQHVAIQGRYLFPVIGAGYVLTAHAISRIPRRTLRVLMTTFCLLLFLVGSPLGVFITRFSTFANWFV